MEIAGYCFYFGFPVVLQSIDGLKDFFEFLYISLYCSFSFSLIFYLAPSILCPLYILLINLRLI